MARKRLPPTDPREWLNRARSNLAIAEQETPGALFVTKRQYRRAIRLARSVLRWAEKKVARP